MFQRSFILTGQFLAVRLRNTMFFGSFVMAISGCASAPVVLKEPDPIADILEKSANSVAESLKRMNTVESTVGVAEHIGKKPMPNKLVTSRLVPNKSQSSKSGGLDQVVVISWSEDSVEDLISHICKDIGWTKGPSVGLPLSPKRVSVYSEDKTAVAILREVGDQLNRSADIVVSVELKTISIRYPVR